MTDKEFILEALKRITPDTSWHGETHADNISIDNIDTLEEMIYFLLDELFMIRLFLLATEAMVLMKLSLERSKNYFFC